MARASERLEQPDVRFWTLPASELFRQLRTSPLGLSAAEATSRNVARARGRRLPGRTNSPVLLFLRN